MIVPVSTGIGVESASDLSNIAIGNGNSSVPEGLLIANLFTPKNEYHDRVSY